MTPQIQFEPSRKQQRLKRMGRSSETERKKLFAIGRLLEVQEERQPRPFLNTALGKLPPEVRVMIYQHLLVIPHFQADSDHNTKTAWSFLTASQPFIHLKKSSLSILRTCRQIKHEAHRILLTSGIPYFANARELLSYLTGVGSTGRLRLEAFRIGDLVRSEPFKNPDVPYIREQLGIYYLDSEGEIACRHGTRHPDVVGAFSLLKECESLHTIYIDMKQGEEPMHFNMLQSYIRGVHIQLHNPALFSWSLIDPVIAQHFAQTPLRDCLVDRPTQPRFYSGGSEYIRPWSMYRALVSSGQPMGRDVLVKVHINQPTPHPFSVTRLGMLPRKLRNQIYHELLAIPPIHVRQRKVTQGIHDRTQSSYGPLEPLTTHVHLHASCLAVLRVCRLMYLQAHPVFFQRQSYYTDNAKEFQQLIYLGVRTFLKTPFHCNWVTSLCVKDLVSWSDKKGHCLDNATLISVFHLEKWKGLRKIYFCMRVGEEMGYLEFLFLLPRMSRGVVDFLDDSTWVIRDQYFEEEWQLQYACFETNALLYKRGKNGEELSDEVIATQRRILRARSMALDMHDGSERYVEVQIGVMPDSMMRLDMRTLRDQFSSLSLDQ